MNQGPATAQSALTQGPAEDSLRSPIEMHESLSPYASSTHSPERASLPSPSYRPEIGGLAKHTLGLILLLCVVFLWTLGNFLGSV